MVLKFSTIDKFQNKGNFKIHSITVFLSENRNNYIFTIDCTLPKEMQISFFNPPNGTIFMLKENNGKKGRGTYTFTVSREKIKSIKNVSMKFNFDDKDYGLVSFYTDQLN